MRVLVSALLFCVPVALFAIDMEKVSVKADQNVTNVVTNDDLNQATNDQMNLDDGATDEWRGGRGGWGGWRGGRGYYGRGYGYGYGGWGGWGYPWYGLAYPYYYYPTYYGWGW